MMGRAHARKEFTTETRVTLLEGDADTLESRFAEIQKMGRRVAGSLIGATISFSTMAVMMALNMVFRG